MRILLWILIIGLIGQIYYRRYKQGNRMAMIFSIAGILISVYLGLGIMLYFMQGKMLYQPTREVTATPKDMGIDFQQVVLTASDGQIISSWYIPASPAKGRWTVLYCHGNAGNNSHRLETLDLIHSLGANCLIVDYRGYGQSSGSPSEQGTLMDIRAGWDWLIQEKKLSASEIIIFGRSLGGSIAAITAEQVNPAAVILESTFTSFDEIGRHYYPWMPVKLFARYSYNTLAATKKLRCPVFVAHSLEDDIVPYKFGKTLYQAAPQPKLFRDLKGDHNYGVSEYHQLYRQVWLDWFDYLNENAEQLQAASA